MVNNHTAHWAEPIISKFCGTPQKTSKYIASFITPGHLELALDRTPRLAQVWLNVAPVDSLRTANVKHYPPTKSRNSNLKSQAKTLWLGNHAWHVKLSTEADLEAMLHWYCALLECTDKTSRPGTSETDPITPKAVSLEHLRSEFESGLNQAKRLSAPELRERSSGFPRKPRRISVNSFAYQRNPYVVQQALQRANGVCEGCNSAAPFFRKTDGSPYLEVHHKITLADGGDDTLENAISLCPNCHRRMHFG